MEKTMYTARNFLFAITGQLAVFLINVCKRIAFLQTLGEGFLGLNGLFTSVLTILSLAELGLGNAMTYSFYAPLAEGNMKKLSVLLRFYKKCYFFIACSMVFIGTAFMPFLHIIPKEWPKINENVYAIYLIFVLNSAVSYTFAARRTLIMADQKNYLISVYHFVTMLLCSIVQIAALLITGNYILFLLLSVAQGLAENWMISKKSVKLYPELDLSYRKNPDRGELQVITRNTIAGFANKIGEVVVMGTDDLLIAAFTGITTVGLYSNYRLIVSAVTSVISQVFSAVTASVGNLGASGSSDKQLEVFCTINFFTIWAFGLSAICLYQLSNPCILFSGAKGLWWYSRYKPILEAFLNLVLSILLGKRFGIIGILGATVLSTILIAYWVEPYYLYKYGFQKPAGDYFRRQLFGTFIVGLSLWVCTWVCSRIGVTGFWGLALKTIICLTIPNVILYMVYARSKEYQNLKEKIILIVKRVNSKRTVRHN